MRAQLSSTQNKIRMTIQVISKATYFPNRTLSESNPTVFFWILLQTYLVKDRGSTTRHWRNYPHPIRWTATSQFHL